MKLQINHETLLFLFQAFANPFLWNIAARLEYRNHWLTRLTGDKYRGCYLLAFCIFTAGLWRDFLYKEALFSQATDIVGDAKLYAQVAGALLFAFGNVFVLSSMYMLGITGTYLGDYFGILMKERVVGFPFSVMQNPMYNGSVMIHLGTALWYGKSAGVTLSLYVWLLYRIALHFESPFTENIYKRAAAEAKSTSRKQK